MHDDAFELKPLSPDAIESAFERVKRYRALNEPEEAESICRDILAVEPENREARIALLLCLTDQFPRDLARYFPEAEELVLSFTDEYDGSYYRGLVCERRAKAHYEARGPQAGYLAHSWLMKALAYFDKAAAVRTRGDDSSILRWNSCVRMLRKHPDIREAHDDLPHPMLE